MFGRASSGQSGAFGCTRSWKIGMTVFSHHDRLHDLAGPSRSPITRRLRALARRAMSRTIAVLGILHRAIITAKTRRLEREQMFHEIPQRPLHLGDKWDF
jgi:hypothetical protein